MSERLAVLHLIERHLRDKFPDIAIHMATNSGTDEIMMYTHRYHVASVWYGRGTIWLRIVSKSRYTSQLHIELGDPDAFDKLIPPIARSIKRAIADATTE